MQSAWARAFFLTVVLNLSGLPHASAETFKFQSVVFPKNYAATIGGELSFPPGQGPFPLVIFLHACGGLNSVAKVSFAAHARPLVKAGFATFTLDSFSARNLNSGEICNGGPLSQEAMAFRLEDAFNAMTVLRKHAKVDGPNIFLVGQSHGAIVALRAALALGKTERFRAVAAFYPASCFAQHRRPELTSACVCRSKGRLDAPVLLHPCQKYRPLPISGIRTDRISRCVPRFRPATSCNEVQGVHAQI